jgi:predicted DNA-binding transcriptional regulator YafY
MDHIILNTIKKAARSKTILRIVYIEKDMTNEGWRYVEPYSFRGNGESEALFAWDINKDGIRRFTLNRIQHAELAGRHFLPRYPVEII